MTKKTNYKHHKKLLPNSILSYLRDHKIEIFEKMETPHVLIFPCPAQGHVNTMLKLAELLLIQNLHITFLNTEYIHNRLTSLNEDVKSLSQFYPKLQFKTISDFQNKEKHPGFGENIVDVISSINMYGKPSLRDIIVYEKISCIILDGAFGDLATDLAHEFGIQLIHFRTVAASSVWLYFCMPKLLECNEIPIRGISETALRILIIIFFFFFLISPNFLI